MEAWNLLQYMDHLLYEMKLSWKVTKMAEGESDVVAQKLSLSSDQLVVEKERVDTAKASLMVTSTCLDKSIMDCLELRCMLVEVWGMREKDLAKV